MKTLLKAAANDGSIFLNDNLNTAGCIVQAGGGALADGQNVLQSEEYIEALSLMVKFGLARQESDRLCRLTARGLRLAKTL